jgi:fibrillarin-like pre-rRNA processing protein
MQERFPGVFLINERIATRSLAPGKKVYGEKVASVGGKEYRFWDPYRSKLSAAILRGLKDLPIKPGSKVLYLGAASGTTASHVSDIVGAKGIVYCVEFAPRAMRDLLEVCSARPNMIPIMADARKPEEYASYINQKVDVIYEDVADPEQARIMLSNARLFLANGGRALIAIKSQSIDVSKRPSEVYKSVMGELGAAFDVIEQMDLSPFDRDHLFVSLRYRGDER